MRKEYRLQNIHCADCARSLEETISSFEGVVEAKINFVTEKFEIEIEDAKFDEVFKRVEKLIRDFSKNVIMTEYSLNVDVVVDKFLLKLKKVSFNTNVEKIVETLKKLNEIKDVSYNRALHILEVETSSKLTEQLKNKIKSLIHTIDKQLKLVEIANKPKNKIKLKPVLYVFGLLLFSLVVLIEKNVFVVPRLVQTSLVVLSALCLGYETYLTAIKMLLNRNINENLLLTISVFGAIVIGESIEGLMVVALYTFGKMLEAKAVTKSRNDIKALMNIKPETVCVKYSNGSKYVGLEEVEVGDIIVVKPGEKVALDGVVVLGQANLDAKSLTGESEPEFKKKGDKILSGLVCLDGVLEIKVSCKSKDSTISKILDLIEKASEKKSKTEQFISKFSKYYTLIVVLLATIVSAVVGIVDGNILDGIYRGLLFLVISCPCAFAISVPLTYFSGVGNASRNGILVKGTNYLDACSKVSQVAFDKTGTLTKGQLKISKIEVVEEAYTKDEILELVAFGEQYSIHPVALAIKNAYKGDLKQVQNYNEIAGCGISFEFEETEYSVSKVADTNTKESTIALKKGNIELGRIYFVDEIKDGSGKAVLRLKELGVKTIMLSGDKKSIVDEAKINLELDEAFGEMLPQDKFEMIEKLSSKDSKTFMYVGDGINDAPSLAVADIGVSMGINGSPASIEASDVVLVDDNPEKIVDLIKISKFTKKIVLENIWFASIIKLSCLILGALGIAKMYMAVFADVGVTIIAVLNSLRALNYKPIKKKQQG